MMKRRLTLGILGALAIGGLVALSPAPTLAAEALPAPVAGQLDRQEIQFTASAAKRERMMIIQQNMNRQRNYGRGGYGPRGGGYGPRGGGYGRGYGYGPRPGYGRSRDYDRRYRY